MDCESCLVIDGGGLTGYECSVFRRLVFDKVDINMYISIFYALTWKCQTIIFSKTHF